MELQTKENLSLFVRLQNNDKVGDGNTCNIASYEKNPKDLCTQTGQHLSKKMMNCFRFLILF
jgi:hypothetical protein